ncbi:hypothetical protein F0562_017818 [Nyssa sinensis]|uniref:WRKY domain-containing protein n=1 Tax=Nyssa sinensis TaxID=561372 RepID=A0A5J4ZJ72_9ASTE|nr:hypothetical protein F0562_017818 [Nyssa sinensis]
MWNFPSIFQSSCPLAYINKMLSLSSQERHTMDTSCPENLPAGRKKAFDELERGRKLAIQLQIMLSKPAGDDADGPLSAKDLVAKILGTFTESLSILNCSASDEVSSQVPANTHLSCDGRKSEDSGESSKTSAPTDRRGCYKRRKTSQTWTRFTTSLIDDGHAWRKYGQKVILNAQYPRNYYRCSHKFDQGCQATKQVQRTEEDPRMYRTTYKGHHICKSQPKPAPHIMLDDSTPTPTLSRDSSILLGFGSNNKPNDGHFFHPFGSNPLIKQESKEELPSLKHNQSSSSDYLVPLPFKSSGPMAVLSPGSDHGDVISSGVYSCTASTHSLEMGMEMDMDMHMMVPSVVDFSDDDFNFNFADQY